jgi:hypothetical protein
MAGKLNNDTEIPFAVPNLTDLWYFANPSTGKGFKNAISTLLTLIGSGIVPVTAFADQAAMLANTSIVANYFAYVVADTGGWALYIYLGGNRALIGSYRLVASEAGSGDDHFKGVYANEAALDSAFPTAEEGDYALVDVGAAQAQLFIWDDTDTDWIASGVTTIVPDADDTTKGIMKKYTSTGTNTDGTMDQNSITLSLPTREFNRAWDSEILFDKNEIAYEEHTLTEDLEYTVAESGHLINQFTSAAQIVITDGTRKVNFTGFNFILGDVQSGAVPDAGTYLVLFLYWNGIATVNWTKPSLEEANLTPLVAPANFDGVPGAGDPDTEIDLTWDAVPNVSSYEMQYSVSGGGGPWIALTNPGAGDTSYTHTGLTEGTTYHYRIRAIGDQVVFSNSGYSVDAATTEDAGDVGAPTFVFSPANAATDVPVNGVVVITASEPIRDTDGVTDITDANITDYLVVKVDNIAGADIPYTATIDVTKTVITITPNVVWPALDNVFIQISGVEDVNGIDAVTASATFATSDFTLAQVNTLDFGDILDSVFAADNASFNLKFTAKELLMSPGVGISLFRKYVSPGQRALLVSTINENVVFKWYGGPEPSVPIREITWANVLTAGEHDYDIAYRGAIDTNNGLDRLTLKIDGVTQGSKSITVATLSWPFNIQNTTAPLKAGPSSAQVKDIIITSADDTVTELNVPIMRTGLDVSGNARHGTWA